MRRKEEERLTFEWGKYEKCKEYLIGKNMYANMDKSHRFYEGNQWDNNAPSNTPLPVINIIKPIVNYKVAIVAQNNFQLNFCNTNFDDNAFNKFANVVSDIYGRRVKNAWENSHMDTKLWDIFLECAVSGCAGIYSYWDDEKGDITTEIKDKTEILFGDEQERDIQKQPYIILPFRRTVAEIRAEAKKNGLSKEKIEMIIADDETTYQAGDDAKTEIDNNDEYAKVLCLLFMTKKNGTVHISKSTRSVQFMTETNIKTNYYPICYMTWDDIKGSARGKGEVLNLIPNQIEVNKTYARRAISIMQTAFPKMAYLTEMIDNPDEIMKVGTAIGVSGMQISKINDAITYLQPAEQGSDAQKFCREMIVDTKENAGAGDVALGNINPEQASGKAILAVKDAAATPLNKQVAKAKKFVEDIGRVWWDMYSVYAGIDFITSSQEMQGLNDKEQAGAIEMINKVIFNKAKLLVRVDATPTDPYSRYAETLSLENYMLSGKITFEEFLEALPDNSVIPKDKLKQIMNVRQVIMGLQDENMQLKMEKEQARELGAQEMQRVARLVRELQAKNQGIQALKGAEDKNNQNTADVG